MRIRRYSEFRDGGTGSEVTAKVTWKSALCFAPSVPAQHSYVRSGVEERYATRGSESNASLSMSSILGYPDTFISMSNSASSAFMTCLTPISPEMPSPHTHSLPIHTNLAPSARALKTSEADLTPLSKVTWKESTQPLGKFV